MARRRKKAKATPRQATGGASGSAPVVEKALPSLPPGAVPPSAFSPELETPPSDSYSGTPGAKSPREQQVAFRKDPPPRARQRDVSPLSDEARKGGCTNVKWLKLVDND